MEHTQSNTRQAERREGVKGGPRAVGRAGVAGTKGAGREVNIIKHHTQFLKC